MEAKGGSAHQSIPSFWNRPSRPPGSRAQTLRGAEWTANFAAVADELQELSREDLKRYLTDNGMPESAARKVAASYSIGALLHQ